MELAFQAIAPPAPVPHSRITRTAVIAGLLVGLAVSFKFSHGPLAVLFPLLFVFCDGPWRARLGWVTLSAFAVALGFVITYGYWGYLLWLHSRTPSTRSMTVLPALAQRFGPATMIRFLADTWRDALLRPVAMAAPNSSVYIEIAAPDFRFVLALGLGVLALISVWKSKPRPPAGCRRWRFLP
ncbi:MAG: hypothetical protein IPK05_10415 [Comamonadaceae bacterium]|nr:hypothetical protein [Comamonadaceae bacterium]